MILRRTMLEEIGLLDEGLYTYFDDADLGLRTKRAGWETWYVTQSPVVHLGGSSTGMTARAVTRRPSYWYQARRRFFLKNYGKIRTALADAAYITGHALWLVRQFIERNPHPDPQHLLADSIKHSVFRTGFRLNWVENPALQGVKPPTEASGKAVGASA
jgi:GT2 family glycosyltransferase